MSVLLFEEVWCVRLCAQEVVLRMFVHKIDVF